MTTLLARTSVIALAGWILFAVAVPANARSQSAAPAAERSIDDVSAAQHQRRHVRGKPRVTRKVYRAPVYAAPVYARPLARGFSDPSIGPDGRPYPRPNYMGGCVIDDGYGRWSACSNR